MGKKLIVLLIAVVFAMAGASAEISNVEYQFVIEENGNTIVGMTIEGSGTFDMYLQEDVSEVRVEGGLYALEGNLLSVGIGNAKRTVVLYKTSLLTSKSGEDWVFFSELMNNESNIIRVAMPKNTITTETSQNAVIESGEFVKLRWENIESVELEYHFPPVFNSSEESNDKNVGGYYWLIGATLVLVVFVFVFRKKKPISGRKEQIFQTLGDNEVKIVRALLEMNGGGKRSIIEKKLGIAKSSLAAAINNLERKKILEVDREYSKHLIKLQDWFRKL